MCEAGLISTKKDKDADSLLKIFRMCLKENSLPHAQRLANKLYNATKDVKYLYLNVELQFHLACTFPESEAKTASTLSLISLFLTKIYKEIELTTSISNCKDAVLAKQLVRFNYRLLEKKQDFPAMRDLLLTQHPDAFSEYLEHLDLLTSLYEADKTLYSVLVNAHFAAFKKNSHIDTF